MSTLNKKSTSAATHEGAKSSPSSKIKQLERSVSSCLLWENNFYENGIEISTRISDLIKVCNEGEIIHLILKAKEEFKLRHVPLFMISEMTKFRNFRYYSEKVLPRIITRPDDITELLAIYWKDGRIPIPNWLKKHLGNCFKKFDEYKLAKYNRKKNIKLKDVMRLCHPHPDTEEQSALWNRLVNDNLKTPDTWEVALSTGENKKETFERLLNENKIGDLAFLRNLRNMINENISSDLITEVLKKKKFFRIIPFQFISAAKAAPSLEGEIDKKLISLLKNEEANNQSTIFLIDVSYSMDCRLSSKSTLSRQDAAGGLAIIGREKFRNCRFFTFSRQIVEIPSRSGMALLDSINSSQDHSGTYLGMAIKHVQDIAPNARLIVITDEQSHDEIPCAINFHSYIINIASYGNGIGDDKGYTKINGFSENSIKCILTLEKSEF